MPDPVQCARPLASLARLQPWDEEDDSEGPLVDLSQAQACLNLEQRPEGEHAYLRRFELGALLIALHELSLIHI